MFYIVCILYNTKIEDVASLGTFYKYAKAHKDVKLLLYDNTVDAEIRLHNQTYNLPDYAEYFQNEGNIGLSKCYNKALSLIGPEDWVMWTDDDTHFSEDYLVNAFDAAAKNKCDVISGIIYSATNVLLSPSCRGMRKTPIISCGKTYNNLYCINSGLCVKGSVYRKIGKYDEALFLDMIDYWFFDELQKHNMNAVLIVPGTIMQDFSGNSKSPIKSQMKRFRIYVKDFSRYCSITGKPLSYKMKIVIKRFFGIIVKSLNMHK